MQLPELYENKILRDAELPVQINNNICTKTGLFFSSHWHEHLEMHYIVEGAADFTVSQTVYHTVPGDFLMINSSELHVGECVRVPYLAYVVIVEPGDLSPEFGTMNAIFRPLIRGDDYLRGMMTRILSEYTGKRPGNRQMCKALVTELMVYLLRNDVAQMLDRHDSVKRKRDLERLNVVLCYMAAHYNEPVSNGQLARLICVSEDRFGHLFREGVGKAPLQYMNEIRLKKAAGLLKSSELTVTQVAEAVGFRDYNHFGRLFRKRYGLTPYEVKSGRLLPAEQENSGSV